MTTVHCGGHWNAWGISEASGVMCRDAYDTPTSSWDFVASSTVGSNSNYTDAHDVDENERTSSICGGEYSPGGYPNGTVAGVFAHFVERALDSAAPSVASSNM